VSQACDFPDVRLMPPGIDIAAISSVDKFGNDIFSLSENPWPVLTDFGTSWDPKVLISAYERALFPMPLDIEGHDVAIGWWSPATRAVFYPDQIRQTRSTRQSAKHFKVTFNQAFSDVVAECGNPDRPEGWINQDVISGYWKLHDLGLAHSVEVWQNKQLVGGLYGVVVGGIFAGESMFHKVTNASKVALGALGEALNDGQRRVIDSQWMTPHLKSLGAVELPRAKYADLVQELASIPPARIGV
jgi:leucyl/phenylalanyl-tRNA--protein transferase